MTTNLLESIRSALGVTARPIVALRPVTDIGHAIVQKRLIPDITKQLRRDLARGENVVSWFGYYHLGDGWYADLEWTRSEFDDALGDYRYEWKDALTGYCLDPSGLLSDDADVSQDFDVSVQYTTLTIPVISPLEEDE